MGESAAMQFGRLVMEHAGQVESFRRFDVVSFIGADVREGMTWAEQKDLAEDYLDLLVGAGVLRKHGHDYRRIG